LSGEFPATDKPQTGPTVQIRPARADDLPTLSSLTVRLAEFPIPMWRTGAQVIDAERTAVTRALTAGSPDAPILVAEDTAGRVLGFAYLETHQDYFTGLFHAHVSILVVAGTAEGRGVGRALLSAAEAWARERGDPFITLNVFAQNVRARALYERLGYGAETLRYVKPLDSADAG
jgi:ribosomal protein S18 acetylase RimI-like enzyme